DQPVPADSRGLAFWGHRLIVADGKNGLRVMDASVPALATLTETIKAAPGQADIDQATAVVMAEVPLKTYAMVADGAHGLRAVNLTPFEDFRTRIKANPRDLRLSFERIDPYTPFDSRNRNREILTYPTTAN